MKKNKGILVSEIGILVAIILALLLPQLWGEVVVPVSQGTWKSIYDLEGRTIGMVRDSGYEQGAAKRWKETETRYAEDKEELVDMLKDKEIDAALLSDEDANALANENRDLSVMLDETRNVSIAGQEAKEGKVPAILVRREDYAYNTAHLDMSVFQKPGFRIAGITGSEVVDIPALIYPDSETLNFNSFADEFAAVAAGKADAAGAYISGAEDLYKTYDNLAYVGTPIAAVESGFAFVNSPKGKELKKAFNGYLSRLITSGEMEKMNAKWSSMAADQGDVIDRNTTGEKGILRVATTGVWFPKSYFSGEVLTGQFVDLVYGFCREEGYTPVFDAVDYPTEIAGLNSGTYDLVADSVYITDERLKKVNISNPVLVSHLYMVVREEPESRTVSKASVFFKNARESFNNNFIVDNRYRMVISGFENTIIIALFSWFFGTLLGALICFLRMRRNPFLTSLARIYIKAIQGIPILVLLLVLYYVVFGSTGLSATIVCIIGFSLDFAAYSSEIFRNGIEAVPSGQARAAKALGFSPALGFFKVVLPQSMKHILPVYSGQLVSMVKLTSVAGYISVMELTKVADIIRSRTYDAFLPLLVSALIYFALSGLLVTLLKIPARRARKGGRNKGLEKLRAETYQYSGDSAPAGVKHTPGEELLRIEHLKKSFGEVTPVKDISCSINRGDVISVIGPSGTGKSTFLYLINRLEEPTEGKVFFKGQDTGARGYDLRNMRRGVGMVFQSFDLFSHLTIVENVMLAQVELLKRSRQEAYGRAMELLRSVGLGGKAFNYPDELSGGQKQRAAIVRTLAMDPEIILFDEPTSALNPTMVGEVLLVIKDLSAKGMTMIIVTHEMKFARNVSTRVFYMDEGTIYEEGTPEKIFGNPDLPKTRQFVNHLRVFTSRMTCGIEDFLTMKTEIEEFAHRNMLDSRILNGMLVVSEELCYGIIAQNIGDYGVMDISFELAGAGDSFEFQVTYGGGEKNPLEEDDIALRILNHAVKEIAYSHEEGVNRIKGKV